MKDKMFTLLALFAMASMLLPACGGGAAEQTAEPPDALHVWIQWGDNPQQIQTLFNKYPTETGINR